MDIEKLLLKAELFKDISVAHRKFIAETGTVKKNMQDEVLFLEGSKADFCYVLISGAIKLFKSGTDGKESIVKLVKPGELFAEVVIFERTHYPVSAIAVSSSSLFQIDRKHFLDLFEDESFRNEYIALLMRKQRYLAQRILYLTSYDVEERFFRFLIERYGKEYSYDVNISKKAFATAIGTIPETFSRLIQRLTKRNIIKWDGTSLIITTGFWDEYSFDI